MTGVSLVKKWSVQEQRCLRRPCSQRFRNIVTTEASCILPLMYDPLKMSLKTTFSPQSVWELQSVIQISPLFSIFWHFVTTCPKKRYENLSNQCSVTIMGAMICSTELESFSHHVSNTEKVHIQGADGLIIANAQWCSAKNTLSLLDCADTNQHILLDNTYLYLHLWMCAFTIAFVTCQVPCKSINS